MGNVAVFDTETRIPAEKISFALNQRLPNDIRIQNQMKSHLIGIHDTEIAQKHMNIRS